MLHIINELPDSSFLEKTCVGDSVIFTDNAVLAVKQPPFQQLSSAQKALCHINIYVRKADLLIRNISINELLRGVVVIDDNQYENAMSQFLAFKSYN